MTVTFDNDQLEELRAAASQAETNLANAQARQKDLEGDTRTPPAILDALPALVADAQAANEAAQAALADAEDASVPFYQQIEAARLSQDRADLLLSQARARQTALQGVDDITQAAKDALQASLDDAQDMAAAAKAAYDALATSTQATRLKTAWDEAQKALTALNQMARGETTPLETVLSQVDAAAAGKSSAQANYQNLQDGARPEQLAAAQSQVDTAQANLRVAQAQVEAAQARVEAAQAQVVAAQAQVNAARAALEILEVQIGKMTIVSPADGVVMTRAIEPGEIASPGGGLLTLGLAGQTITVYIAEDRYGEISLGQTAAVSVDSFPGEEFEAVVTHIAEEAEFTPRNVQTAEGRKNTVFAIQLKLDDSAGKLKPGMPADVVFK
jgi:hypothetical protein